MSMQRLSKGSRRARALSFLTPVLGIAFPLAAHAQPAPPPPASSLPPASTAPGAGAPSASTPPPAPSTAPAASPGKAAPAQDKKVPPPQNPIPVRLWIIAPAPTGWWTLRIDNEDTRPIRIPADARLLAFEVERADPQNPKRKKTVKCKAPRGLLPDGFPEQRALLLGPGESYAESFNPKLICFGKNADALTGGAVVRTRFGWAPAPKGSNKPPQPPFAAQGTDDPPTHAPLRELTAPTMVLSYADGEAATAEPEPTLKVAGDPAQAESDPKEASRGPDTEPKHADKDTGQPADRGAHEARRDQAATSPDPAAASRPEIIDANAPRLELSAETYEDASAPRHIAVTVTAKNAGNRAMTVALRTRMLSFKVEGPDQTITCEAAPATHAIPRDRFQTLKPGGKTAFTVLLAEACPREAFKRAGLYRVWSTLLALESGKDVGVMAYTGVISAPAPTLVRLQTAAEPYHRHAPKAVPTPAPAAARLDPSEHGSHSNEDAAKAPRH